MWKYGHLSEIRLALWTGFVEDAESQIPSTGCLTTQHVLSDIVAEHDYTKTLRPNFKRQKWRKQ